MLPVVSMAKAIDVPSPNRSFFSFSERLPSTTTSSIYWTLALIANWTA